MGPKKKAVNKKKAPKQPKMKGNKSKPIGDDDDEVTDDNGIITPNDVKEMAKSICAVDSHLNKIAAAFIDEFKERSSLSIGCCLVSFHEYLTNIDHDNSPSILLHRIVILYLLYRIRDIEPSIKRRPDKRGDSLIGHAFAEVFLSLVPSSVPFQIPQPALAETQMALLLMSRKGAEIGPLTAQELVDKLTNQDPISPSVAEELSNYNEQLSEHWPASLETRCSPGIMENPQMHFLAEGVHIDRTRPITIESLISVGEHLLVRSGLTTLPITDVTYTYQIPTAYPITVHEVMHESFKPDAETDGPYLQHLMTAAFLGRMKGLVPHAHLVKGLEQRVWDEPSQPTPSTSTSTEAIAKTGPSIAGTLRAQMTEYTDKLLSGKTLSPSELRVAIKYLECSNVQDELIQKLIDMPVTLLPRLIEDNVKVAQGLVFMDVSADHSRVSRYINVILGMDIIIQSVEIVKQLYENIPKLDTAPLLEYVRYCIQYCQRDSHSPAHQSRLVRMICMFVGNLLKKGVSFDPKIFPVIRSFVLEFNKHKESMSLYQAVMMNMQEEEEEAAAVARSPGKRKP